MFKVGVDAAVGNEPDEMEALACGGRDGLFENLVFGQGAVADRKVDAGKFLIDDATGTEVEVSNLGIPHLSFRQANLEAAGLESAPRIVLVKAVMHGGFGKQGGVPLLFGSISASWIDTPAITDKEKNGLGHPARITQRGEESRVDLSRHLASDRMAKTWGLRFLRKKRTIVT